VARSTREAPGFVPPPAEGAPAAPLPAPESTGGWAELPAALLLSVLAAACNTADADAGAAARAVYAAVPRVCRVWRAATHARAAPGAWAALLGLTPLSWRVLAGAPRAVLASATRVRLPPPAAGEARLYARILRMDEDFLRTHGLPPQQTDTLLALAALHACPRLASLRLGGSDTPALWHALMTRAAAAEAEALRALDMSRMSGRRGEKFFARFLASPAAACLEDVALGGVHGTDATLTALAAGAGAALTRLSVREHTRVTDAGAAALAGGRCADSLVSIALGHTAVGASRARVRANSGRRYAPNVAPSAWSHVASSLMLMLPLSFLRPFPFRRAGDAGAGLLVARCGVLRALSLRGCVGVTDATLRALAPGAAAAAAASPAPSLPLPLPCPALTELDVSHTRVTRAGVAALRAARPALRVNHHDSFFARAGEDGSSADDDDDDDDGGA
jgi:hypothetical protein